jgi:hypothetical protein
MSKNKFGRRSAVSTPWVLALTGAAVAIAISLGAATASNAAARPAAMPAAQGAMQRVVVLLRNTNVSLHPSSAAHLSAIRTQMSPLVQALRAAGATHITTGKAIPYFSATVSASQQAALAANPAVRAVFPDEKIRLGAPLSAKQLDAMQSPTISNASSHTAPRARMHAAGVPNICGTATHPEKDPEALDVINGQSPSYNGAGVNVAYIAGHINTTISDFQRNPAYVGPGSPAGAVVSEQNFNGDQSGVDGGDLEAFLDMSSIAAQGNVIHDLSQFVNPAHPLPSGCDLTITGDAPGATVTGLNVFSDEYNTTTSYFVQAIDWAVANNINVINESFGSNPFPQNANDAIDLADEAAVHAGVTVVVSSGDSGITSTTGSPATDPKLISAGASTTFRSYEQYKSGVINATNPVATNGTWINNNISSISSGGYSQSGGNTVNLVAPGDLNWIACDTATCGGTQQMTQEGGTSESSPLTAGAAADVISAYRATHGGHSPSPALVKTILLSTASDVDAPAEQQGAGILNIGAAINLATTINHGSKPQKDAISFSTNQINIQGDTKSSSSQKIGITNNGKSSVKVKLSTRALTKKISTSSGSICLNPTDATIACGPPTTNTLIRETGGTQVYVEQQFNVPNSGSAKTRLNFSASIPAQNTNFSPMRVALYAPNGSYAGYSIPQGIANYANVQVADPQPGKWTAVFADAQNNAAQQGTVKWEADTWKFTNGGSISPGSLTIAPGHTMTATYKIKLPKDPGDTSQSIVVTNGKTVNTIPVTIRTLATAGTSFAGVLTGGNGRGNPAQTSTYAFKVPAGKKDIEATVVFDDINDAAVAFLQNPQGNNVAQSSNLYQGAPLSNTMTVYKDHPAAGTWTLVVDWLPPVSGSAINTPFVGTVTLNGVHVNNNLPTGATIPQGSPTSYTVSYKNTSPAPELIFLDPRQTTSAWLDLPDLFGNPEPLAFAPNGFQPTLYAVPPNTTKLFASLDGTVPVTFDFDPWTGDPDLYASGGMNPTYTYTPAGGVTPGFWGMFPSEIGPFGAGGADTTATATPDFQAWTPQFDPTVSTDTSDLWSAFAGLTNPADYAPIQVNPGQTKVINLSITPTAAIGMTVHGTINVDDDYLYSPFLGSDAGGDQIASIPYSYKVGS